MRRIALPLSMALSITGSLAAQAIRIGVTVVVAVAPAQHPLTEAHVAVDPSNPNHLLAAAIVDPPPGSKYPDGRDKQNCAAFLSRDAGMTWSRHDFDTTWCFDPWVAITPDGQAIVTMVAQHPTLMQQGRAGLVAFHSGDGGRTWDSLPIGLGRNHDHPTMAVDLSSGARRGWIYLSSHQERRADDGHVRYGVYLARSRNGGKTFDDPVYLIPNNLHNLTEMPVVLSDGTLVESFVDCCRFGKTEAGQSTPTEQPFDRRRAWIVRSTDGGYSFSMPLFVTDACGPPPAYRLSAFAADASSGPFGGRLYFVCRAAAGGPIVVASSPDRGETWTSATAVHPATSSDSTKYPIPGAAVNDRGVVLIAWDGGAETGSTCERSLFVAASRDGGQTFSQGSLVASCIGGGDYFGLTAVPGGTFRLLWPETRDGVPQLRTTIVTVEGNVVSAP